MMYFASILFFASVSAIPTGRVEIVFPSVETSRSGVKIVKYRALGEDVELKLEPAGHILAEDFAIYNSNNEKQHTVDVESLRRRMYRDDANGAVLLIDDAEELPSIEGTISFKFRITPHEWKGMTRNGRRAHQIEEIIIDESFLVRDSVIPLDFETEMRNLTRLDKDKECIVIEYLIATESAFTEAHKSHKELTEYITSIVSGAEGMYRRSNLKPKLRLLGIQTFTKEDEPAFIKDSLNKDGKYYSLQRSVKGLNKYYCKSPTDLSKKADIIYLFTKRNFKDDVNKGVAIGVMTSSNACHKCNKVGVLADSMNYLQAMITLAHESAHGIGVPHDGDSTKTISLPNGPGALSCKYKDGYIMGTSSGVNSLYFSKCSKECMKYFLSLPQSSCLHEKC